MRSLIKTIFILWTLSSFALSCASEKTALKSDSIGGSGIANPSPGKVQVSSTLEVRMVDGFGIKGEAKSCSPMDPGTICTTSYTDEDRWADKCRASGAQATQCGCHAYICSEKLLP